MRPRLRDEGGFALIEMLIAIVVINVGLLAILLALTSGVTTLRRSAEASTASAVADRQLERYRAQAFASIYLDTTALAATDSTYQADAAYSASQVEPGVRDAHPRVHADADRDRPGRTLVSRGHLHRVDDALRRHGGQAGNGRRSEVGHDGYARTRRLHSRHRLLALFQRMIEIRERGSRSRKEPEGVRFAAAVAPYRRFSRTTFAVPIRHSYGGVRVQRYQRARGRVGRSDHRARRGLRARASPAEGPPAGLALGGRRRRGGNQAREARQGTLAAGLLAAVRDDDRRGPERRLVARHPRTADRRQGAGADHQRGALRRRGRDAALAGDGEASQRLRPPLHLDDRGRRGSRHPRHGPRPRRDPDREGDEDSPPRARGDDLPARRSQLRDPDPDRDAALPRPGLREHLRRPRRRPSHAHEGRRRGFRSRTRLLVHPLSCDGPLGLGVPPLEEDSGRPAGVGPLQAAPARRHRQGRPEGHDGALLAHARDARRRGRRHHQGARDLGDDIGQLGRRVRASPRCARRCTRASRSPSR